MGESSFKKASYFTMPGLNRSEVAASAGMREAAAVIAVSAARGASSAGITVHMRDRAGLVGEVFLRDRNTDAVIDDIPVRLFGNFDVFVFAWSKVDNAKFATNASANAIHIIELIFLFEPILLF